MCSTPYNDKMSEAWAQSWIIIKWKPKLKIKRQTRFPVCSFDALAWFPVLDSIHSCSSPAKHRNRRHLSHEMANQIWKIRSLQNATASAPSKSAWRHLPCLLPAFATESCETRNHTPSWSPEPRAKSLISDIGSYRGSGLINPHESDASCCFPVVEQKGEGKDEVNGRWPGGNWKQEMQILFYLQWKFW